MLLRPGAALAASAVANHYNPAAVSFQRVFGRLSIVAIAAGYLALPAIAGVITLMLMWFRHDSFLPTFNYCLVGAAVLGAINGIVMEWEDNQPGGWDNP
jgi:hypothetical protein